MFNKLKLKIKNKLKEWLGIKELENKFNKANRELEWYKNNIKIELNNINRSLSHNTEGIKILHNTIENVVHIGTDVREYHYSKEEHSWAVVCIEGKMNIVKFINLNRNDGREILDFLKHFEAGRHCIDTPNLIFYDNLFKF